ncbi:MAG: histidine kinase [Acidipropionibacterium sp.]|nr:histidine kinase [Acidipropionibacterium sp.]
MTSDSTVRSAAPGHYPPPLLTRWQQTWRWGLCILISLVLLISFRGAFSPLPIWLDLTGGAVSLILVGFRRRYPLPICLALSALSGFSTSAGVPAAWGFVSLCTGRRWREILPATVALLGFGAINVAISSNSRDILGPPYAGASTAQHVTYLGLTLLSALALPAAMMALGLYTGARRDLIASLSDRAETAEREQQIRALAARSEERNRIAREMHDSLAHQLTLVSMHAGALASRDDLSPEQTRQASGVIQEAAGRALNELRGILGSLRNAEDVDGRLSRPQPTLADLADLMDEMRAAGARIELEDALRRPEAIPAPTGRNLYRILAECLTNAGKHAPGTVVRVALSGREGEGIRLRVANAVYRSQVGRRAVPGSGSGLIGVAERVESLAGRIDYGARDGEFVVEVRLPW